MFSGPGVYYIINQASSTAFDLHNGVGEHIVHGWQKLDDQRNQQWRVTADPQFPDMWILRNMDTGKYLNSSIWNGNGEIRFIGNNIPAYWWLAPQPDKTTAICFPDKTDIRVADLHNGSTDNGTVIRLLPWNMGSTQKWKFEKISD
ncbi:unnamed protein product [Rhizoctonia solani]|uniref:Ricin B lectin domain-containing protein n=1 Tax=Rhizoctonia solani TaxID=456999 RepID=A0A8H3GGC2_9AGAM|nr:unnamed protein product [Rhizoctonia solani]